MQATSQLYNDILISNPHWFESSLIVSDDTHRIGEDVLISMSTSNRAFKEDAPSIGGALSGEIDIEMFMPRFDIPRMAKLIPCVRITDGSLVSEWLKKGVYYVDTREVSIDNAGNQKITIHGYDAMLKAEVDYDYTRLTFPVSDIDLVEDIASSMGVDIDQRTYDKMNSDYQVTLPAGYTQREILGYLASMYCGNFIISDVGKLRLVSINEMPVETKYLIAHTGEPITFGGDHILV